MNNTTNAKKLTSIIAITFLFGSVVHFAFAQTPGTASSTTGVSITPPIILNVLASGTNVPIARITWTTDQPSDTSGALLYSATSTTLISSSSNRCDNGGYVLQHCIDLNGTYYDGRFYYKIESRNTAGLITSYTGHFLTLSQGATSTTPPLINSQPPALVPYTVVSSTTTPPTPPLPPASPVDPALLLAQPPVLSTPSVLPTTLPSTVATTTNSTNVSAVFTKSLSAGMTGPDVKRLQTILALDGSLYPERTISGHYDFYTVQAVKKFQDRYNLATPEQKLTADYGAVGTKTATMIYKVFGLGQTTVPTVTTSASSTVAVPGISAQKTTSPVLTRSIQSLPVLTTTQAFPNPTVSSPVVSAGATPLALKSTISLKGTGDISNGREMHISVNQPAASVEMRLSRANEPQTSLYLGQASYDSLAGRWLFQWDSTQTPDGSYTLFPLITTPSAGIAVPGDKKIVTVNNKKGVTGGLVTTSTQPPSVSVANGVTPSTTSAVIDRAVNVEKFIEQIRREKSLEAEQVRAGIENILITNLDAKNVDSSFKKATDKKIEELKSVIYNGDNTQKNAIVAEMVNSVVALGGTASQDTIKKGLEVEVAKLEQVVTEQKTGVVDAKNFSVDTVAVAEVVTKLDGTQTAGKITFAGKALPNSFATVYIFSIPVVVTVKTDKDGYWNYTLDKELEDGSHEVYVAITDVKGAVVAKSTLLPFIKEASAVTVEQIIPSVPAPMQQNAPSFTDTNYFYVSIIVIVLIVSVALLFIGFKMRNTQDSSQNTN